METNNPEIQEGITIEDPKAVLSALERAKNDAKRFREEKENLSKELESKEEMIAKYSGSLLKEKVSKKIQEEGIKDPERLLKFIDMTAISFDNDFEIIGFEDQIQKLRTELPEIFDPKLRVGGQADTAVKASVSTQYSASQLQAMKVLGKL